MNCQRITRVTSFQSVLKVITEDTGELKNPTQLQRILNCKTPQDLSHDDVVIKCRYALHLFGHWGVHKDYQLTYFRTRSCKKKMLGNFYSILAVLKAWFLKLYWKFISNAKSRAPPRPTESETLGVGLSHLCLPSSMGYGESPISLRNTVPVQSLPLLTCCTEACSSHRSQL